jgi:hypothetical protein
MTRNEQPAPGGHRAAGLDHYSRTKYSPPPTLSDHVQLFYDNVRACRGCEGPILPLDRRGDYCADCYAWLSGAIREQWARERDAITRISRLIRARRAVVALAIEAIRDELFDYPEAA